MKQTLLLWTLSFVACFTVLPEVTRAEVKLHGLFNDHMVLQRDMPVQVYGTAAEGEEITVTIYDRTNSSTNAQTASTKVKDGKWKLALKPLKASHDPIVVEVTGTDSAGKSNKITLNDILVGEVWFCGGQSNMELNILEDLEPEKVIAGANHPLIRLITIPRPENSAGKRFGSPTPVDDVVASWTHCTPKTIPHFSSVAYHFAVALQKEIKVPIGLINSNMSGTPIERWISKEALQAGDPIVKKFARAKGASTCFNSLTYPLVGFTMRGVIWYQGETNENTGYQYRFLMPTMFKDWRARWGQGDFPFLYVQIAPYKEKVKEPQESGLAEVRESQLLTLNNSPNVAMVTIPDYGDVVTNHPLPKKPTGERLALAARAKAYGEKIEYQGPMYRSVKFDGNKAIISFTHVGKGLEVRGTRDGEQKTLTGLTMCGDDKKFHNAMGKIVGDTIEVTCKDVEKPVAVRFGWADYPLINLFNKDGLPASPFRTDTFKGVTQK